MIITLALSSAMLLKSILADFTMYDKFEPCVSITSCELYDVCKLPTIYSVAKGNSHNINDITMLIKYHF